MINDPKAVALAYIEGCSRKDFESVAELLAPDILRRGPIDSELSARPRPRD